MTYQQRKAQLNDAGKVGKFFYGGWFLIGVPFPKLVAAVVWTALVIGTYFAASR